MSYNSKYKGSEVEELLDSIGNKVDKVDGKQLSTEDFTTLLKQKLEGLSNYDDTAIQASVSKLRTDLDTLVSGDTTTAIKTFNEVIAFLDGLEDTENLASIIASIEQQIANKQEVITDLATIREGAALGATALQEVPSGYAKTDDIPTKVSELENDANYISDAIYPNGVYIQDIEGKLWLEDEWDGSVTPNGIAVITGQCRFVIALEDTFTSGYNWGGNNIIIDGITTTTSGVTARSDYKGKEQTDIIISSLEGVNDGQVTGAPAAEKCKAFVFPDGSLGYLGALGEWWMAMSYKESVKSALLKCGGSILREGVRYYTSTQSDALNIWCISCGNVYYQKVSKAVMNIYGRAFTDLKVKSAKERIEELESTKQDTLVSGTNIKTINGESIVGSGDIVISGGSSSGGAYAEVNHGTSDTTFTLTPNTFHVWDEVATLDLSFGAETSGVANEYLFQFTSGATATTLTLPSDIKWANDVAPTIAENMIYQISVLRGLASVLEFSNAVALIENKATISNGMMQCTVTFAYPVASEITVNVRSGDGPAKGVFSTGDQTKTITLMGPSEAYIESITPSADSMYIYTF